MHSRKSKITSNARLLSKTWKNNVCRAENGTRCFWRVGFLCDIGWIQGYFWGLPYLCHFIKRICNWSPHHELQMLYLLYLFIVCVCEYANLQEKKLQRYSKEFWDILWRRTMSVQTLMTYGYVTRYRKCEGWKFCTDYRSRLRKDNPRNSIAKNFTKKIYSEAALYRGQVMTYLNFEINKQLPLPFPCKLSNVEKLPWFSFWDLLRIPDVIWSLRILSSEHSSFHLHF